jgi:hypothetical protein
MTDESEEYKVLWNGLTRRYAEIVLEIREGDKHVAQLRRTLIHLEATMRMYRPDFVAEGLPVRQRDRHKSPYFKHGEITARIYDALRDRDSVGSGDIATGIMHEKDLDPADKLLRMDFVRRVTLQLRELARRGHVEKIGGRGPATRWRLKPPT